MIEVLVNLPSPIPELQHAPLPPKCCEPWSVHPTPCSSIILILYSHLNLLRSLGARQYVFDFFFFCKLFIHFSFQLIVYFLVKHFCNNKMVCIHMFFQCSYSIYCIIYD
jgi:hypothetical protein